MNEGRAQRCYAVLALVFGVPGLVGGGGLAVFGIAMTVVGPGYMDLAQRLWLLGFGLAGGAAPVAFVWLSWVYLRRGRQALLQTGALVWTGYALGLLTGLFVLGHLLWFWQDGGRQTVALVLAGLLLAIPGAALGYLRWPQRWRQPPGFAQTN